MTVTDRWTEAGCIVMQCTTLCSSNTPASVFRNYHWYTFIIYWLTCVPAVIESIGMGGDGDKLMSPCSSVLWHLHLWVFCPKCCATFVFYTQLKASCLAYGGRYIVTASGVWCTSLSLYTLQFWVRHLMPLVTAVLSINTSKYKCSFGRISNSHVLLFMFIYVHWLQFMEYGHIDLHCFTCSIGWSHWSRHISSWKVCVYSYLSRFNT